MSSENFTEIPVIDIRRLTSGSEAERKSTIDQLRYACENVGFFYIYAIEDIEPLRKIISKFFDLPMDEKQKIHSRNNPKHSFWGYTEIGAEQTENGKSDWHETVDFGPLFCNDPTRPMHASNQYVSDDVIAGFKSAVEQYFNAMLKVGRLVMHGVVESLGLPADAWDGYFDKSFSVLRFLRYPPVPGNGAKDEFHSREIGMGIGEHTDYGGVTLLWQDETGGLQVKNASGQWIDAIPIPGTLVCNLGDMLMHWSGNRYLSTPHRVINRSKSACRYSIPFFYEPNYDAEINPLKKYRERPIRVNNDELPDSGPVVYGEYLWKKYQRSFPDAKNY